MSDAGKVQFGVLGPLLVRSGGTDVQVRRGKQRAVLATLLLNAGHVVSVEKLIDVLWAESPPASADVAVRNYVMRLRRELSAENSRIRTRPPGYLISVGNDELDLSRFEELLDSARTAMESGSWAAAADQATAALALWRGDPLSDVESDVLSRTEVPRLTELRLRAVELRVEADLHLGRHVQLVAELEHLTAAHPLRENLRRQLMLALHRGGRQAEALAVYQRAREVLVDELGIEPGAELRELHQQILSGDCGPAASPGPETAAGRAPEVPRQLPPVVGRFVGRERELAVLSGFLDRSGERPPGSVVISAIGGTAGVGKTALAVQWAHQVSDQFPDGQLYVNLRGYDPEQPVEAGDALARFLRALGLPGERIPDGTDARAAEFRSLLAGRRALVVLDNAREAGQVRPLLPGSSSCLVVVTSRDALSGLVARDGAARVNLDLLPPEEAARLLRDLIGDRAAADPAATARLAESCCRLPLALRVAAELANDRPDACLTELAAELADRQGRLDLLQADGDARTAVREVFSWSYRSLDSVTARTFRLIGLHPGPDFDAYAAAALAGADLADAQASLGQLARAHLIQPAGAGRYGLHDLLRDYARELAAGQDDEQHRRDALTRLFDYYSYAATLTATIVAIPEQSEYIPARSRPATPVPAITDTVTARAWLEAEGPGLMAAAVHAADHGWPRQVITLSVVLFAHVDRVFLPADSRRIHASAYRVAQAMGDRNGEAHALNGLAVVDWRLGKFHQAARYLHRALRLFRDTGDGNGETRALNNLGTIDSHLGRFREAAGYLYQSLAVCREAGDRHNEARALLDLMFACARLGRYREAVDHGRAVLALALDIPELEAYSFNNLGSVYLDMGRYQVAGSCLRQALDLHRKVGDRLGEAGALIFLADVEWRVGQYEQAASHIQQGLALCREGGEVVFESRALYVWGDILLATGRLAEARTRHSASLALSSRTGDPYEQARAHQGLGRASLELGDPGQARSHWEKALSMYTEMGVPVAEEVRILLSRLPASVPEPR